jgi:hypothetical protein
MVLGRMTAKRGAFMVWVPSWLMILVADSAKADDRDRSGENKVAGAVTE